MADADLIFPPDNRTIFLKADRLTCQAIDSAQNTLLQGVSVDLSLYTESVSGAQIGTREVHAVGSSMLGISMSPARSNLVSSPYHPVPTDPIEALKVDRNVVDLANELRLLHQAVLILSARLAKLGG
jgi:hypothetical protein